MQLPPAVDQAFARLVARHEVLQKEMRDRLPGVKSMSAARQADLALDAAYSAIADWCRAYPKLPESLAPGLAEKAKVISATLFPSGLSFTKQAFQAQWSDSKARVQAIRERGLDQLFDQLSGTVFWTVLQHAHEAYGKALGLTAELELPEPAEVRQALLDLETALRGYVLQVTAFADVGGEQEAETAKKLLQPLIDWPTKPKGSVPSGDGDEEIPEEP